jgi:hypothetical protein
MHRSDMHLLCKESAMHPLRRLMQQLDLTNIDTAGDAEVRHARHARQSPAARRF